MVRSQKLCEIVVIFFIFFKHLVVEAFVCVINIYIYIYIYIYPVTKGRDLKWDTASKSNSL